MDYFYQFIDEIFWIKQNIVFIRFIIGKTQDIEIPYIEFRSKNNKSQVKPLLDLKFAEHNIEVSLI